MRYLFLIMLLGASPPLLAAGQLLRLHGSNTIGAELGPHLVERWLASMGYTEIESRETAPQERMIRAQNRKGERIRVEIQAHGSSTGFRSLEGGKADVAMASRPIKAKELKRLAPLGGLDSLESEHVLGLDGIAVIVHPGNPLQRLDKAMLQRIFAGEITNWQQLGDDAGPIHLYARDDNSGTYDTFKSLVLGKRRPLGGGAKRFESNAELSDAVAADPGGIGFVGLPYIRNAKALAIADGGGQAIAPNSFSVATEDYALARRLYLYIPQNGAHPLAQQLVAFAHAAGGQQCVAESGFVSQSISRERVAISDKGPREYLELVAGAERLSLNFRFRRGSAQLDNKARQDIRRLADYMGADATRGRELILIGFSDRNEAIPLQSLALSIQRADHVADVLLGEGVTPHKVRGYGPAISIASNASAHGREKNRRVEVWLR